MEQRQQHTQRDDFVEQFVVLLGMHWEDILLIVNRQSPRLAVLLRGTSPSGMKRMNGGWRIQISAHRIMQRENLCSPRDNEIVAQAIRLYYHQVAQFRLPRITVEFLFASKIS
jgi:hypothetical protein